MPFGFKHNNRSRQALNDPSQGTPTSSGSGGSLENLAAPNDTRNIQHQGHPAGDQQQPRPEAQQPCNAPAIVPDIDYRAQQKPAEGPTRSQSTRYSTGYQHPLPPPPQTGSSDDLGLRPYQQQGGARTAQAPVVETKNKKSLFDRMRSSGRSSESSKPPPQASYNNTTGLARRLSKKENPPIIRTAPHAAQRESGAERVDWQFTPDSRTHLPSPQEANEDGLDPYLIREPEQGHSQTGLKEEIHQQQPTIRPVQSESEAPIYSTEEDRQQFEAQQHLREQQIHHHQYSESSSQNYYPSPSQTHQPHLNISPTSVNTSEAYRNPETVSQLSAYESPTEPQQEQRPVSVQSQNGQSPTSHPQAREYPNRTTSIPPQGPRPLSQHLGSMAPPGGASVRGRAQDTKTQSNQGQGQSESRDGPPPNYSRGNFPSGAQPPTPGLSPAPSAATVPNYRGGPPQRGEQYAVGEQGRSTPPPAPSERDVNDAYKELLTKYKKVKGLYFDKTAQVEQLQNTLANQRLSQSRTSLDDSEYMTRFQRLDGAITNLAFNIRKDWRTVPNWLAHSVNQDAIKIGKQEMTAVGRACITKFLVDEIFTNCFHPGLDGELSANLKNIEQNIRRFSPQLNNQEESDALTAKVVQWRLATLEGLKDVLTSSESEEHKKNFSHMATSNLSANLINYLQDPVPPGLEDSAHMIVELAVSVASNLPLESRDISIVYPMPGDMLQPAMMKVESQIPTLETSISETEGDSASTASAEKDDKDGDKDGKNRKEKTKSGMLQAMMGNNSSSGQKKGPPPQENSSEGKKGLAEDGAQKVRFAGFVGVEVRGRQVLVKAPVWAVG
ncbi:uncharacterized protein PAC_16050 [Phialocephala subalpina]|uniref:S-adenosylmethionine-dependent methyltransferase-like protein n=1 Tax=Phialocephala subalpina TaxID=576137 RepID=A0A1L7XM93_9HELO|nr:uncharacterized protein PAC_16050 [Phialocephala subalpina]